MTPVSRTILALAMALMPFAGAFAKKSRPRPEAEPDSVTRMAAVFVAENTRRAVDAITANLEAYGAKVDPDALRRLVAQQLTAGTDAVAYAQASKWISAYMDANAGELSRRLLEAAAAEPGAEVLASGVVVRIVTPGKGSLPTPLSYVTMRYTGLLPDGTEFDSIGPDEPPMRTRVSDLAPGMAEALTHIPAGATAVVTVPSGLAYGSEGIPGVIPPDSALRFEIELIDEQIIID